MIYKPFQCRIRYLSGFPNRETSFIRPWLNLFYQERSAGKDEHGAHVPRPQRGKHPFKTSWWKRNYNKLYIENNDQIWNNYYMYAQIFGWDLGLVSVRFYTLRIQKKQRYCSTCRMMLWWSPTPRPWRTTTWTQRTCPGPTGYHRYAVQITLLTHSTSIIISIVHILYVKEDLTQFI